MMTIDQAIQNVDEEVSRARASTLRLMKESERRFVDSVTARGAMTTEQALSILDEQREAVLDEIDAAMIKLRAWILRGGIHTH